jgi:superoxide dismutase, Cu-Zn family
MRSTRVYALCFVLSLAPALAGCGRQNERAAVTAASKDWEKGNAWNGVKRAVAVVHPTAGHQARGVVHFVETGGKVRVAADLEGLAPNQKHGFHIHEFGDCSSPDASSAGEHYNPEGHPHALPPVTPRHAGDLGNVQADASDTALSFRVRSSVKAYNG